MARQLARMAGAGSVVPGAGGAWWRKPAGRWLGTTVPAIGTEVLYVQVLRVRLKVSPGLNVRARLNTALERAADGESIYKKMEESKKMNEIR